MDPNVTPSDSRSSIKSTLENSLIFNPQAVEIAILDRWGKAIWKMSRKESDEPIQWDGNDSYGMKVNSGSLMCKITYADKEVIYVPFVFIQR